MSLKTEEATMCLGGKQFELGYWNGFGFHSLAIAPQSCVFASPQRLGSARTCS